MREEELRIGNWVSNIHDIPMIVKAIYKDTVYVDFKGNVGDLWEFNKYEPFKPIELTEEILLKCGFVRDGNTDYYTCRKVGFTINLSGSIGYRTCIWTNEHINHLHQLQNLYFALTGKELNIEL